jgi:hypothetical protein
MAHLHRVRQVSVEQKSNDSSSPVPAQHSLATKILKNYTQAGDFGGRAAAE